MFITPSLRTCSQGSLVLLALICKGFPRIVKLFVMAFLHPKICKTAMIASSVINKECCCSNEMQLFPQFGIYTHLYKDELGILFCHFSWYICQQMMCFKGQMKISFTFVSLPKYMTTWVMQSQMMRYLFLSKFQQYLETARITDFQILILILWGNVPHPTYSDSVPAWEKYWQ